MFLVTFSIALVSLGEKKDMVRTMKLDMIWHNNPALWNILQGNTQIKKLFT